ncbi:MAG TPA: hypothetical protein PKL08_07910 [Thermoanaerobaculaceae bacterium]|nr:hypothetical protein [Thermoanaerobaculaceae bacterium]
MRRLLTAVVLVLVVAAPAGAQFRQYFAPGSLGETEDPLRTQIDAAMEQARWHLGPIRLQPWIGIRNIGYIDNVYGTEKDKVSDFTVSAGAGLRAYMPLGAKTVVFARALPEYVYWKKLENRRVWAGRYSAGFYVFFNRLTAEVWSDRTEQQTVLNAELETPITNRLDGVNASLELRLLRRLSLVAQGARNKVRISSSEVAGTLGGYLKALERDEDVVRAGLRYSFSDSLSLTVGGHRSSVDFLDRSYSRSNNGDGLYGALSWKGQRLSASATVSRYAVTPRTGSQFVKFEGTTGQASLGCRLTPKVGLQGYAGRTLVYSTYAVAPYYTQNVVGAVLSFPVGWRIGARLFGERGTFDYPVVTGSSVQQNSHNIGLGLTGQVFRSTSLGVTVTKQKVNYSVGSREVWRVQTSLGFAGTGLGWW